MFRTTTSAAAAILAATLGLGACGTDPATSSPDAPSTSAGASTGPAQSTPSGSASATTSAPAPVRPKGAKVVRGTGYSFAMPKGWVNLTRKMRKDQPSLDVAVGNEIRTDGFTDNLTVTLTPTGAADARSIDEVAEQILAAVRDRAPTYAIRPNTSVAGVPAAHLSGMYADGKRRHWLEQFVVVGNEQTMVISFSLAPGSTDKERTRLINRVLKSWQVAR